MRPYLLAGAEKPGVIYKVFVAEHRAFWKTCCSRGVLDLGGIIWLDIWQFYGPGTGGIKLALIFQIDDFAEVWVAACRLFCNIHHWIAPKIINHEKADGTGLLQYIS